MDQNVDVIQCLDFLSQHYGQKIFRDDLLDDTNLTNVVSVTDQAETTSPPRFLEPLLETLTQRNSETEQIVTEMIDFYVTSLQPSLWIQSMSEAASIHVPQIAVLQHYGILLNLYLRRSATHPKISHELINKVLQLVAFDITAAQQAQSGVDPMAPPVLLLFLLRFMTTLLSLCGQVLDDLVSRHCLCALSSFLAPSSYGMGGDELRDAMLQLEWYSCKPCADAVKDIDLDVRFLWEQVGLNRSDLPTSPPELVKVATTCIQSLAGCVLTDEGSGKLTADEINWKMVEKVGAAKYSELIRLHFFGRDNPTNQIVHVVKRLHLGTTITERKTTHENHYKTNRSRLRAVLSFCGLIETISRDILKSLAPILYELLNSSDNDEVRWGGALLFRLASLSGCPPYGVWSSEPIITENLLTILFDTIKTQRHGPTLAILGTAQYRILQVQSSDHAGSSGKRYEVYERRLKVTQQWLHILQHNNAHHCSGDLIWGVVFGGVLPSVFALCQPSPDAKVLSLGRPGLQAILPILQAGPDERFDSQRQDDYISYSIRAAALLSLANLMLFSYHVTQRHTGKIVCTLIAFLRRRFSHASLESNDPLRPLGIKVAAIATIVGQEAATKILDKLTSHSETGADLTPQYDKEVHTIISEVRQEAGRLLSKTK